MRLHLPLLFPLRLSAIPSEGIPSLIEIQTTLLDGLLAPFIVKTPDLRTAASETSPIAR